MRTLIANTHSAHNSTQFKSTQFGMLLSNGSQSPGDNSSRLLTRLLRRCYSSKRDSPQIAP
jgi:hypothetical protein